MLVDGGWTLPAGVEERAIRNPVAVASRPRGEDPGPATGPLPGPAPSAVAHPLRRQRPPLPPSGLALAPTAAADTTTPVARDLPPIPVVGRAPKTKVLRCSP